MSNTDQINVVITEEPKTTTAEMILSKLNQESHQRHLQPISQIIIEKKNLTSKTELKNGFTSRVQTQKMQTKQTQQGARSFVQMLQRQIGKVLDQQTADIVQEAMRKREQRIYMLLSSPSPNYMQMLGENSRKININQFQAVSSIISSRNQIIEHELQNGQILIHRQRNLSNKKQLELLHEYDLTRMIKIKDGQLRNKLDILRSKIADYTVVDNAHNFRENQNQSSNLQRYDPSNFQLNSQKTKIAKEYIKHMKEQKKLIIKRQQEREQMKNKEQQQRAAEQKQAQQMRDIVKKQQLLQKIEQRRRKRQSQEKQEQQKYQKVQQTLREYRKSLPLFRLKQKQYNQTILKPQIQFREQRLMDIKKQRRSMSIQEINSHEQKYLKRLQQMHIKKEQQLRMQSDANSHMLQQKKYYRSVNYSAVQQQMREQYSKQRSMSQQQRQKVTRVSEYALAVRKDHIPSVDAKKRQQLLNALQEEDLKKRKMRKVERTDAKGQLRIFQEPIPQKNSYVEGNKFMQVAKRRAKRLNSKINIQEVVVLKQEPPQDINLEQKKSLKSIWEVRIKQLNQLPSSQKCDPETFQHVKKQFENLDLKAAQKEVELKQLDMSLGEVIQQKGQLDQYYLQAVKKKINLLY